MFEDDSLNEIDRILNFIRASMKDAKKTTLLIACSGGIDSSVSLALSVKAVGQDNVRVLFLPYRDLNRRGIELSKLVTGYLSIPSEHIETIDIQSAVQSLNKTLMLTNDNIRLGNIMARVRMICLFDDAKKHDSLVVGTENRSEYYLGYFTRFGDEASDLEPIRHLYKTQVITLAKKLTIPQSIIDQAPTAGLYAGQTDEAEFGFTYEEADKVLQLHFDDHISFDDIDGAVFPNKKRIQKQIESNEFKHHVPYFLKPRS